MSDKSMFDFSQFVPGFNFLKGLMPGAEGKPAAASGMFSNWLAPTVDPAEVQKRIDELKTVQFWLEQNGRALNATIQALEVQKLTLETLKNMNSGAKQMAQAFQSGVTATASDIKDAMDSAAQSASQNANQNAARQGDEADASAAAKTVEADGDATANAADAALATDAGQESLEQLQLAQAQAMQWWSALSEQFQTIASNAINDLTQNFALASSAMPGLHAQMGPADAPEDGKNAKPNPKKPKLGKIAPKPAVSTRTAKTAAKAKVAGVKKPVTKRAAKTSVAKPKTATKATLVKAALAKKTANAKSRQ